MSIMSGIFMKSSTIPVEPFSTAYLIRDEQNYDYSPSALFSPLDDMPTDFASESVTSPTLENPNDWTSFDSLSSPDVFFKSESLDDSPILTSISPASPLIDHMDLAASALPEDNVSFGGDGNSMAFQDTLTSPLFPSPQLARGQNPPPINRNAVRPEQNVSERSGSKRKSPSSSPYSTSSSPRSSTSPPPRPVQHLPPKKTAHNMIEKRYRNNLNDKISALRDAVPALRVMVHRLEAHASPDDDSNNNRCALSPQQFEEDLGGLAPAHKLNKATILSKATEYINHLERKNRALARENQGLRGKVDGLEILVMNGAAGLQRVHQQQPQQWC